MAETTAETVNTEVDNANAPKDDIAALRAEMEQLKRERDTYRAESQSERTGRLQAEQRGMSEAERRLVAEENACKSSIESLNGEADSIEAEIARLADEPGHGAEISKLTRRLTTVINKAQTEEQRQTWLAGQREKAKVKTAEATDATNPKLANDQPLSEFSAPSQVWLKNHPQVFTDKAYFSKVVAIASYANSVEGLAVDTPEYFAYVDERLSGNTTRRDPEPKPDPDEGEDLGGELDHTVKNPQTRAAGPGAMQRAMAAVAPPSRAAASSTPSGQRRAPLLSADEREVADKLYSDKFKNPAERYVHYADMKKYQAEKKRHGFGAN